MSFKLFSGLKNLAQKVMGSDTRTNVGRRKSLRVESLEDRQLLSINTCDWNLAGFDADNFGIDAEQVARTDAISGVVTNWVDVDLNTFDTTTGLESTLATQSFQIIDGEVFGINVNVNGAAGDNFLYFTGEAMTLLDDVSVNGFDADSTLVIWGTSGNDTFTIDTLDTVTTNPVFATNPYEKCLEHYKNVFGEDSNIYTTIKTSLDAAWARLNTIVTTHTVASNVVTLDGGATLNFAGFDDVIIDGGETLVGGAANADTFEINALGADYQLFGSDLNDTLDFSDAYRVNIDMGSTAVQHAICGDAGTLQLDGNFTAVIGTVNADRIVGAAIGTTIVGNGGSDCVTVWGNDGAASVVSLSGRGQSVIVRGDGDYQIFLDDNADCSVVNATLTSNLATLFVAAGYNDTATFVDRADHVTVLAGNADTIFYDNTGALVPGINIDGDYAVINAANAFALGAFVVGDHAVITGSANDDYIEAYGDFNYICAGNGDDFVDIYGSYNTICAGNGDDVVYLSDLAVNDLARFNKIYGGDGDDILDGVDASGDFNYFFAGAGNDVIFGTMGNDYIYGNSGINVLVGLGGADYIFGGCGRDLLIANTVSNEATLNFAAVQKAWFVDNDADAVMAALGSSVKDDAKDFVFRGAGNGNILYANPTLDGDFQNALEFNPFNDYFVED